MNSQERHERADRTLQRAVRYLPKDEGPTRETNAQAAAQMCTTWLKGAQETRVILGHGAREATVRDGTICLVHSAVPTTGMGVSHG